MKIKKKSKERKRKKNQIKIQKRIKKKIKIQNSKFKIEVPKIFKVQNPKPEIQNPKILFRDYVQKNLKSSLDVIDKSPPHSCYISMLVKTLNINKPPQSVSICIYSAYICP